MYTTNIKKGDYLLNIDYDKALYYTLWGQWDDLLVLMVRTNDDLLSKKIEQFLHAYHYPSSQEYLITSHEQLMHPATVSRQLPAFFSAGCALRHGRPAGGHRRKR